MSGDGKENKYHHQWCRLIRSSDHSQHSLTGFAALVTLLELTMCFRPHSISRSPP